MRLILFGDIQNWANATNFLTTHRPDIHILGLSSLDLGEFSNSTATFTLKEVLTLYENHDIDGVLNIQGENPYYFNILEQIGIRDIYVIPHTLYQRLAYGENISNDKIVYPYHDVLPELMQLEVHLADHCNLNCKGCSHFSNLVSTPVFPDKSQFKRDVMQLTTLFSQIHTFYFLGGEPLLNPDLSDYIHIFHQAFPYSNMVLVTNGLLLPAMKQELMDTLRDCRVHISISDYSCLDTKKIVSFIQTHRLSAELREGKECFSKYLNPKGDSDKRNVFQQCIRRNCTFLATGKIAACCQPFTVHYFNEYFDEHLPEDEGIDLYEKGLDGWEILNRLITPMESCRYCDFDVPFNWEPSKAPYSKDDWCV